ncbi:SDR family NAD(P)-dependent oxidoreductase [Bacillus toyonensis]|uniref:UDP-glucose 4-epimerase n=1 Tax=Bacillus toyonensis TaxID=155322 RepID=A0A2B5XYM5_9BACI|nr:SDR family NAD(P)-dependent oxidoreductase [Bacillus toyonensis]PGB01073.1 UDP-glucose 4-epimerase [Bacillus toyonensis]PHD72889.1 UDP-glucose 4-epimerase [Bacillus toyonensis]
MKVLITGGAGFIGSHLALKLLSQGKQVVLLDNFHSYYAKSRKQFQLEQVQRYGKVPFYECDILHKEDVKAVMQQEKVDAVIHLAGFPGVRPSLKMPGAYIDINIKGTSNVLTCAGEENVKKIIVASSSSVYGEQTGMPLKEEMANGRVLSPYAASKYGAESLCHAYQYMYGFQMNILRFFTVYGPWGRPDMAIGSFIRKLLHGKEIVVYGKGTGRDYTYIDDITEGITLSLESNRSDVYNLGSNAPILMTELLTQLEKHFPLMRVNREAHRKGDVTSTWADISKAKEQLGYEPRVSFAEGLERTIVWAKKYPDTV